MEGPTHFEAFVLECKIQGSGFFLQGWYFSPTDDLGRSHRHSPIIGVTTGYKHQIVVIDIVANGRKGKSSIELVKPVAPHMAPCPRISVTMAWHFPDIKFLRSSLIT